MSCQQKIGFRCDTNKQSNFIWTQNYFPPSFLNFLYIFITGLPGGSRRLSVWSGAAVAALAVIGLALALVTGVTAAPPFAVTLLIADLVASFTSLNLSMN